MNGIANRLRIYDKQIKSLYCNSDKFEDYTFYEITFQNLSDLHAYLKTDPEINSSVFSKKVSEEATVERAGVPYEQALKYVVSGYAENYDKYLSIKKQIDKSVPIFVDRREPVKSVAGSRPNIVNFIAGVPNNMYKLQRKEENKFITIHFNLGYPHYTTQEQVRNRGILSLNLIKLLELNGYKVKLNTFFLIYEGNEIMYIKVNLKRHGELISERKCYYPMCSKEFFRRVIFRVMETMPVKNLGWSNGYGGNVDEDLIRSSLGIPDTDIVVNSPAYMGVLGFSIEEDAEKFIEKTELTEFLNTKKLKK